MSFLPQFSAIKILTYSYLRFIDVFNPDGLFFLLQSLCNIDLMWDTFRKTQQMYSLWHVMTLFLLFILYKAWLWIN